MKPEILWNSWSTLVIALKTATLYSSFRVNHERQIKVYVCIIGSIFKASAAFGNNCVKISFVRVFQWFLCSDSIYVYNLLVSIAIFLHIFYTVLGALHDWWRQKWEATYISVCVRALGFCPQESLEKEQLWDLNPTLQAWLPLIPAVLCFYWTCTCLQEQGREENANFNGFWKIYSSDLI
jgi:hypothetical protein